MKTEKKKQEQESKILTHKQWEELMPQLNNYGAHSQRKLRQRYCNYIRGTALIHGLVRHCRHMYEWYERQEQQEDEIDWTVVRSMLPEPQHIWFTQKDMQAYELRPGRAPADDKRPDWLKYIDMNLDYMAVAPDTWRKCVPGGEYASMVADRQEYNQQQIESMYVGTELLDQKIIIG